MDELAELPSQAEAEKYVAAKAHRKPNFEALRGVIQVIDPDWHRPQEDVEAWLKGDV